MNLIRKLDYREEGVEPIDPLLPVAVVVSFPEPDERGLDVCRLVWHRPESNT